MVVFVWRVHIGIAYRLLLRTICIFLWLALYSFNAGASYWYAAGELEGIIIPIIKGRDKRGVRFYVSSM